MLIAVRNEQGRDLNTSSAVLTAIARAFRLTSAERSRLSTLVGLTTSSGSLVEDTEIHPTLVDLLTCSPSACAIAYDPWFNMPATTSLAREVFGLPERSVGSNLLWGRVISRANRGYRR
jgi:hypothetical protein